jgi:hypothetical protein
VEVVLVLGNRSWNQAENVFGKCATQPIAEADAGVKATEGFENWPPE